MMCRAPPWRTGDPMARLGPNEPTVCRRPSASPRPRQSCADRHRATRTPAPGRATCCLSPGRGPGLPLHGTGPGMSEKRHAPKPAHLHCTCSCRRPGDAARAEGGGSISICVPCIRGVDALGMMGSKESAIAISCSRGVEFASCHRLVPAHVLLGARGNAVFRLSTLRPMVFIGSFLPLVLLSRPGQFSCSGEARVAGSPSAQGVHGTGGFASEQPDRRRRPNSSRSFFPPKFSVDLFQIRV